MATKHSDAEVKEMARRILSGKAIGRENAVIFQEMLGDPKTMAMYNKECAVIEAERAEKDEKYLLVRFDARYGRYVRFENFGHRKAIQFGESKLDVLQMLFNSPELVKNVKNTMTKAEETGNEYRLDVGKVFDTPAE